MQDILWTVMKKNIKMFFILFQFCNVNLCYLKISVNTSSDWPETRALLLQSINLFSPWKCLHKKVRSTWGERGEGSQVRGKAGSPQPPRVALKLQNCSLITAVNRFLFLSLAALVGWQLCPCFSLIGLLPLCALKLSLEKICTTTS